MAWNQDRNQGNRGNNSGGAWGGNQGGGGGGGGVGGGYQGNRDNNRGNNSGGWNNGGGGGGYQGNRDNNRGNNSGGWNQGGGGGGGYQGNRDNRGNGGGNRGYKGNNNYKGNNYQGNNQSQMPMIYYPVPPGGMMAPQSAEAATNPGEVVEPVVNFIKWLHHYISLKEVYHVENMYEDGFYKISEYYFKDKSWPTPEVVQKIVEEEDEQCIFIILYRELFYRHIYARLKPTIDHRFESFQNYCDLFSYLLVAEEPVQIELPNKWLWDIIDEFVYQFQSFQQFKSKAGKMTEDDKNMLRDEDNVWKVTAVLNILMQLTEKCNINAQLEAMANGEPITEDIAGEFGMKPIYKMTGFFSLVGLLRLYCLLGDYHMALDCIQHVQFKDKDLMSYVPACQITANYYAGFANFMIRKYANTINLYQHILGYIQRTKQFFQNRSFQAEDINKKNDQMLALLAIASTFCPLRLDESVNQQIKDKLNDKANRLTHGDMSVYDELFFSGCPKFFSPVIAENTSPFGNSGPRGLQLQVFKTEVDQQRLIPTLRSYLKLYSTLPISKLAKFMDMQENEVRCCLMAFKHKKEIAKADGEDQTTLDIDFYVDNDMVHISDTKIARHYGDYYVQQILKLKESNRLIIKSTMAA